MLEDYKSRCVMLGQHIAEHGSTVRQTAAVFGISKSTVHKDVTEKLRTESPALYKSVLSVLCKNKAERHLRGGQATKLKYELLKDGSSSSVNDGG